MFTDDQGLLNNFAKEPKLYYAQSPTKTQQRNYLIQGLLALVLVGSVIFMAIAVS